jgi:hypothetical protein
MNFGFQIKLELDLRYATYHIKKQKINTNKKYPRIANVPI